MKSAFATSLDQLVLSPAFPMWLTLAAAGFFAVILLLTLARAERSVANGALTVITLLAIGIAVAATQRGFGPDGSMDFRDASSPQINAALPALSCIDDLAGESVETACERVLFGSAESAAAAVSYAASRLSRLVAFGNVATANKNMTPELEALRRSIQRDRYGLIAYVLVVRDHCRPSDCLAFRSLTDRDQIAANMVNQTYDVLVSRYAPSWNAPAPAPTTVAALPQPIPGAPAATAAALPPLSPGATGKPTTADFPSAASIPPVSIMTPEPTGSQTASAPRSPPSTANAQLLSPQPVTTSAPSALKKPAAKTRAQTPVQLAPAAPKADN
jgi:hypothetical protein